MQISGNTFSLGPIYKYVQLSEGGPCHRNDRTGSQATTVCNLLLGILVAIFLGVVFLLFAIVVQDRTWSQVGHPSTDCARPVIRQEWRSLNPQEQSEYLAAVKCLTTKPSRLGLNHSLHEDFAHAHVWYGHDIHEGPLFLPYHRWFLHLYEHALREECYFTGYMVYWDWSLDWNDPYHSSLLDTVTGFGGEGSGTARGIRGYCADDGPLGNYTVSLFDTLIRPHCLSREFLVDEERLRRWAGEWRPTEIEDILAEADFSAFTDRVEEGPHKALPIMLHGDFSSQSAPVDPLFYLHHANLDRLYLEWQLRDPKGRFTHFSDKKTGSDSLSQAGLNDQLWFGDLGDGVRVHEVLRTESTRLCYRY